MGRAYLRRQYADKAAVLIDNTARRGLLRPFTHPIPREPMKPPALKPAPCCDCVQIHGDDPAAWLNQWPKGAEYRDRFKAHLCDGCADDRDDWLRVELDDYDLPPYSDGY